MDHFEGDLCPICGCGILIERIESVQYRYKTGILIILDRFLQCNVCTESVLNEEVRKLHEKQMKLFNEIVDMGI